MRIHVCRKFLLRSAVLLVWLTFFAQLALGSNQLSLTSDEPPHFAHGYVMLTTGNTWALLDHRHPPLLNVWGAWPLLLQPEHPDPRTMAHWDGDFVLFVRELWPKLGPVERLACVTRYPQMLLGLLLMAVVYRWARERFGRAAGLLAVTVMAFDPTMIAHAQLNTTDVGMAFFAFACLYLVLQSPNPFSWQNLVGIGVTLGATLASKGSGVMLVPVVVVLLAWQETRDKKQEARSKKQETRDKRQEARDKGRDSSILRSAYRILYLASCILFVAVLLLWASYGFRLEPVSPDSPVRLPLVSHARMVRVILAEKARTAFLWGEVREGGWWWYFPVAFVIKTPIPILVMILWTLLTAVIKTRLRKSKIENRKSTIEALAFWLFPAVYLAVAVRSGMNIGYRHLLPVFPFVYVAIGRITNHESRITDYELRFTFSILLAWLVAGTLRVYPFDIAYFNEAVGGPRNGYRYLVDSNVDWGQSFKALRAWMDETGTEEVRLSYYTWIDPVAYGVNYHPLPPSQESPPVFDRRYDPEPGVYAISATPLQGVMVADADMYDWFRHREPVAQPGYGLLVYEVAPHPSEPQWLAQCAVPVAPLTADAIVSGFGRDDLRTLAFDCTQSWVYPEGGASSGWYALHADVVRADDGFQQVHLDNTQVNYVQCRPGLLPPFTLYEQPVGPVHPATFDAAPVEFDALTFLGYTVLESLSPSPGDTLTIESWWRVDAVPERPLSLMLHLVGPDGHPVIVGDGLGVPREVWRVGDVIVQRHALSIPADAPVGAYTPQVGVYWLDTLARWTVRSGPQAHHDALHLSTIDITSRRKR